MYKKQAREVITVLSPMSAETLPGGQWKKVNVEKTVVENHEGGRAHRTASISLFSGERGTAQVGGACT